MDDRIRRGVCAQTESGVAPVELLLTEIDSPFTERPVAYRTETVLHSIPLGADLLPEDYTATAERADRALPLLKEGLRLAIEAHRALRAAEKPVKWISVAAPVSLLGREDLCPAITGLLAEEHFEKPGALCLSFSKEILTFPDDATVRGLRDLRPLGVRTMVTGCDAKTSPLGMLASLAVDFVLLDRETTALLGDRDHPMLFSSLTGYLTGMGVRILADGITDSDGVRALTRCDCSGYIPDEDFRGKAGAKKRRMTLGEVLAQEDDG